MPPNNVADRLTSTAATGPAHWFDNAWWEDQIDQAIATPDPVLANLRITIAHYQLSLALRAVLAPAPGANFHTWATWGSKKAGVTIRQADVPHIHALTLLAGGWGLHALTQRFLDQASRQILGGNITVLDEIGRQTARFVCTFHDHPAPEPQRLADFLGPLRTGPTAPGGQDLLRHAFSHYYQARHTPCGPAQHEQMLLGNLYAILHEHVRLQPFIAGAMPRRARRLITRHLLTFRIGGRQMSVSRDVIPLPGGDRIDFSLESATAQLRCFLAALDGRVHPFDGVEGSRASNWADLHERMKFICALFRTGHNDPSLFHAPYTVAQRVDIAAGRVPRDAL